MVNAIDINTKKKISFVSPNFQQGPTHLNAHTLPYAVGVLWSYSSQFKSITDQYVLDEIIWKREKIQDVVEKLKDNYLVGFSTYVWNKNYNYKLAEELKKVNSNIIIVFGGPEPAITDENFYVDHPYIDVTVVLEGEITFKKLLECASKDEWVNIQGLLINNDSVPVSTGDSPRINNLNEIPSPYTTGVFDTIIKENPDVKAWNPTIETNRGCPYQCTFCDWGGLTYSKIKKYNLDRVYQDLEWAGKNNCDFFMFADANFGIFPERDHDIARKIVDVKKKYGNPKRLTLSFAKNQKKEVVDIVKTLVDGGVSYGLNVSLQTTNEDVLEIIKRKNLEMNKINEIFALCEQKNITMHTELILGLPGETLESWEENFYKLYEIGNHTGIIIFQTMLLENAEMNLVQRKTHDIGTTKVQDFFPGDVGVDGIDESIDIITRTSTMTTNEMVDAQMLAWFHHTFHITGFSRYYSRFLHKSGISYKEFYRKLLEYIKNDPWFYNEYTETKNYFYSWFKQGKVNHPTYGSFYITGYNLMYRTTINIYNDDKVDYVHSLMEKFVKEHFTIDERILKDLTKFQRLAVIDRNKTKEYPITETFEFDIRSWIVTDSELESQCLYEFDFPTKEENFSKQHFIERLFFSKKANFTDALIRKLN